MRQAQVYVNNVFAGILTEQDDYTYLFKYDHDYLLNPSYTAISLTLPKTEETYHSQYLFSFFFNLLAEGANETIQNRLLKIDEKDYFTRLIKTAHTDTIGAVTIKEIKEQ
ncbi:HipA N-terminal domain-containing protein [Gabonibacter sp. KD22]|nr:HipA N-terminal domain-containing protein [Gabonibacter chumensis]MCR9012124.1 HipA N-terminal domain-containing protein [Gabonibacter chumensis]